MGRGRDRKCRADATSVEGAVQGRVGSADAATWSVCSGDLEIQGLPDTLKYVALSNPAGVTFIDGGTQRSKLRLVLLLVGCTFVCHRLRRPPCRRLGSAGRLTSVENAPSSISVTSC